MNLMGILDRLGALLTSRRPGNTFDGGFTVSQTPVLQTETQPLYANSAVMSILNWTVNNAAQARLETWKRIQGADQDEILPNHPAALAWDYGHPIHGRDHVEAGVYLSLVTEGTSFVFKIRGPQRRVIGYQYLPHFWCSFEGYTHVWYRPPFGDHVKIPVEELIINRIGVDPYDDRKGYSPLKTVLNEVLTDNEAAQYMRVVLRNFGIIGGIMSPKDGESATENQIKQMRSLVRDGTSGENRGYIMLPNYPVTYQEIGATPEKLVLEKVRRIPEERISAVFNIPAVVLGLGAGLDKSTYNNIREAKRSAWTNYLIPLQSRIARQWNRQMLTEFETDPALYLEWDRKHVEALAEDEHERAKRYAELFKADIITRDEARGALDFPDSGADGYYSELSIGSRVSAAKAALADRITGNGNRFDG